MGRFGLFIVEDIYNYTYLSQERLFFILPKLSFTFAVNFIKGEIYF